MEVPGIAAESTFDLKLLVDSKSDIDITARRNRTALIRAYEAQLAGDLESWWAIFDKEVEFYEAESLPYGVSSKGLEAAKQGVAGMFSAWSHLKVVFEEFVAAGDLVICYIQMTATSRKTGEIYQGPVAETFRFRDGKVIEWRPIYWDTHRVRELCM